MRIDCKLAGHEACYIDVADRWTRGEIRQFWTTNDDEEATELFRSKLTDLHLVALNGDIIDDPEDLTTANIDGLDYELYIWLSNAFGEAINQLQDLTKKNVRSSFSTTAAKKA